MKDQAYAALGKWIERLSSWQYKAKKDKKSRFKGSVLFWEVGGLIDFLVEVRQELLEDKRTPEEAMAVLHLPNVQGTLNEAMKKGL